jgi:hypothetical protein
MREECNIERKRKEIKGIKIYKRITRVAFYVWLCFSIIFHTYRKLIIPIASSFTLFSI